MKHLQELLTLSESFGLNEAQEPKTTSGVNGVLAYVDDGGSFKPEHMWAFKDKADAARVHRFYAKQMADSDQYVEKFNVDGVHFVVWHDHRSNSNSFVPLAFGSTKLEAKSAAKKALPDHAVHLKLSDVDYLTVKTKSTVAEGLIQEAKKYDKEELNLREKLIDRIEGFFGDLQSVHYHIVSTDDLAKMFFALEEEGLVKPFKISSFGEIKDRADVDRYLNLPVAE